MFNIDEILKLKEAGFEDATILQLVERSSSNVKEVAKTDKPIQDKPLDLPEVGKPQEPTKEPTKEDLRAEFKSVVDDALKEFRQMNINNSQQPARESVDDILAGIINPKI